MALTAALARALDILSDDKPHDTCKERSGFHGRINGNVAGRLVDEGLAFYERCRACGHGKGVRITVQGKRALANHGR